MLEGIPLVSSLRRLSRQVGVDSVLLVEEMWRPLSEFFAAVFQYLKSNGDMEETEDSIRDVESNVPAIDVLGGNSHKQIGEILQPEEDGNTNYPDFKPECVGVFEVISIDLVTILQIRCRDEAGS
ncbi:uncharacterized protein DS421_18g615380 [Arachis hypogaea]|nr:uncharacterized protein DS421_18g615380 [Arachis hypogaea]